MELKNQPIYKGVHKTLCINFRAYAAFYFQEKLSDMNLCLGNKYPLKVLLVVHIEYSLTRRSNSEDKNARKKY